jgi:hypothetical protein
MAVVLGTNSGFVTTRPTADPSGLDTTIEGASAVTKHTSPANAISITEIGWYRGVGTRTENFSVGLYAADGATVPGEAGTRLYVDATNSSSTQGWITTTVDWDIDPSTDYWLGVQMSFGDGSSNIDGSTSGAAGKDYRSGVISLGNPYGGGALADADGAYAIYALVYTGSSDSVSPSASPSVSPSTSASASPSISPSQSPSVSPSQSPSSSPSEEIPPTIIGVLRIQGINTITL